MAKRFTDTDKWKRPWFRKLPAKAKLAWVYLLDECDHAGIWIADFELMSFQLDFDVSQNEIENWFEGKIQLIDSDKFFIPSFIEFQYGELRDGNAVHKSVIGRLNKVGVDPEFESGKSESPKAVLRRLSTKKKREVMNGDYFTCTYCGTSGDEMTLVIDHIIPRSKGGENSDDNLTTACLSCNSKKSDMDPIEFISRHGIANKISVRLSEKLTNLGLLNPLNAPFKGFAGAKDKDIKKEKETDKEKDQEKESARAKKSSTPAAAKNPNLIAVYCDAYFAKYGNNPTIRPQDAKQLKDFAHTNGVEKTERLLVAYLEMRTAWFVTKQHDLATFLSNANQVQNFLTSGKTVTAADARNAEASDSLKNQLARLGGVA